MQLAIRLHKLLPEVPEFPLHLIDLLNALPEYKGNHAPGEAHLIAPPNEKSIPGEFMLEGTTSRTNICAARRWRMSPCKVPL